MTSAIQNASTSTSVILPYRGEFGFIIMEHAPQINAIPGPKIVCIEAGNEALYPGAAKYIRVERRTDRERRARNECEYTERIKASLAEEMFDLAAAGDAEWVEHDPVAPRKYFSPQPYEDVQAPAGIDVVICPRMREYGSDKNWPHWQKLADSLRRIGMKVYAAGAPDSSFDVNVECGRSWDARNGRFLDATIAAMHKAKFVIATDAGLAHLAVMCGRPLLMITHKKGLVAPGRDDVGNDYWPVHKHRYNLENHTGSEIDAVDWGFTEPGLVAERAFKMFMRSERGAKG